MEMASSSSSQERSKNLHNFNSLPCFKWGNQRLLRCVKVTTDDVVINNTNNDHQQQRQQQQQHQHHHGFPPKPTSFPSYKHHKPNPILVNNVGAKRLKLSSLSPSPSFVDQEDHRGAANNQIDNNINDESPRPWNLRTRRAACKAPLRFIEEPTRRNNVAAVCPRRNLEIVSPRRNYETLLLKRQSLEMKENVKFSVSLSKEEIEEDFIEMLRIRPPRRPKKRPRVVQKYLDTIFPGLWLAEVTPDSYKVPETRES